MDQEITDKTYDLISFFCFGEMWGANLRKEVEKPYFQNLFEILDNFYKTTIVEPDKKQIFRIYRNSSPDNIKIVFVGDDPIGDKSAIEIFKKTHSIKITENILEHLFFINTILTINQEDTNQHRNIGWEQLVEETLNILLKQDRKILFIFVGENSNNLSNKLDKSNTKHTFINIDNIDNVPNDLFNIIENTLLEYNIKLTYIDGETELIESSSNNTAEQT